MQSYNPENFSIQCARKQNYEMFYETGIRLKPKSNSAGARKQVYN